MTVCQIEERDAGRPYPRTCPTCGLTGACVKGLSRAQLKESAARLEAEAEGAAMIIASERTEVLRLRARVAELEASLRQVGEEMHEAEQFATRQWNAAIRAALGHAEYATNLPEAADRILTLLRNEGGSDDQ